MKQDSYLYRLQDTDRFIFTSFGKVPIIKAVDFVPTSIPHLYGFSFGDLQADGTLDDMTTSNNGDIVKVLSTVVQIARNFTAQHPDIKLFFGGSTDERTKLYPRILKMYAEDFEKEFIITAFIKTKDFVKEVAFEPEEAYKYLAFFITRK